MTEKSMTEKSTTEKLTIGKSTTEKSITDIAIFLMDLQGGGAERVMLNLAEGLSDCGLQVDLVLVQAAGEYLSMIPPNLRLVVLDSPRLVQSVPALSQYLRQHQPRALLSALEDTNIVAILAKRWAGVTTRLVVTVHNQLSQEVKHATNLKRRLVPYLIRWIYPWADAVVGVSQGVVDDLIQFGCPRSRTHAIYNPIITPTFVARQAGAKQDNTPAHAWFEPQQPPVILGVGRLNQQKDFATLIRAFAQLRQRQPARLMILGEGSERDRLENLVAELGLGPDDVSLPGFVGEPISYMSQAAMLVLSSAWEGFGNVLVEAMAVGTPVVSTCCDSGPAEILADGQYGKLVRVGDGDAMAEAMWQTLQSMPQPVFLQQRAQDFSLARSLEAYQQLLMLANS
jgi:glycosyltransferase involved in cell wall biosynthesis